jgi:hypothetical protein
MEVDPVGHMAHRLSHAVTMLCELIPYTNDVSLPAVISIACLEDWFTNYRLVIEFLVLKPPANCASAQDFVPGWKARPEVKARLARDYGWASEDVSHIGRPQKSAPERGAYDPPALRAKAEQLLSDLEEFVDTLAVVGHDYEDLVRVALTICRKKLESH